MREWLSWWSTTLPRSGSRVRVPSRALNDTKKDIRGGYPFFVRSSPAWRKHRGLRSTPVVAKRTSTGCSATSRTLKTRNCVPVNAKKKQGFTFARNFPIIFKNRSKKEGYSLRFFIQGLKKKSSIKKLTKQ